MIIFTDEFMKVTSSLMNFFNKEIIRRYKDVERRLMSKKLFRYGKKYLDQVFLHKRLHI